MSVQISLKQYFEFTELVAAAISKFWRSLRKVDFCNNINLLQPHSGLDISDNETDHIFKDYQALQADFIELERSW